MRQQKSAALKFRERRLGGLSFQRQPRGVKQHFGFSVPGACGGINKLVVVLRRSRSQEQRADMHRPETRGPLQPLQASRYMFWRGYLSAALTTQTGAVQKAGIPFYPFH